MYDTDNSSVNSSSSDNSTSSSSSSVSKLTTRHACTLARSSYGRVAALVRRAVLRQQQLSLLTMLY
jgi:hypothetical protein